MGLPYPIAIDNDYAIRRGFNNHERTEGFASRGGASPDQPHVYAAPARLGLNRWALSGDWTVEKGATVLNKADGRIVYQFYARDLHLVMGPTANGTPVRFRVRIDGKAPGAAHGMDVDEQDAGTVVEQRLYQLVRQPMPIAERQFEIEFLDPGGPTRSRSADPAGGNQSGHRARSTKLGRLTMHMRPGRQHMKIFIVLTSAAVAIAASPWSSADAANVPGWCANSGYDNGPPRSRGPGNGPSWQGEPGDCQSIWRRSHYRGTDPDPFIRLQLMRYRHPSKKERRTGRN